MENSFKVGDRVRCIQDVEIYPSRGKLGTICSVIGPYIGVAFDEEISGHTCNGICADGHGLYCFADKFIPAVFKKASEREYITEI